MIYLVTGILLVLIISFFVSKKDNKEEGYKTLPEGCCGAHEVCESETLLSGSDTIVYFEDEELDIYAGVSKIDYGLLKNYLTTLEGISISSFSRPEQRAFWINLYNAATVNLILEHYPVESITKISFSFFSFGPWDEELLTIEGEELSLNDIEHRILRPIWQDPRIHYALNCASMGCPNLQPLAFTAKNTDSLLETGASEYINHPRGAKKEDKKLWLSKIFEWYQDDYGGNEAGVLLHLQKYAKGNWVNSFNEDELEIEYHYDWRLNKSGP